MANQLKNDPKQKQNQQGAPQNARDMPSSGNSPNTTGAESGTDEGMNAGSDVERSGGSGTATQRAPQHGTTSGDPGKPRE